MIWVSRLRNALADDDLTGAERSVALVIAIGFVALGATLVLTLFRRRRTSKPASVARADNGHRAVVDVLVAAGILRWTLRAPVILLSDEWSAGFKTVHTILWVVTVALSAMAWREVRRYP